MGNEADAVPTVASGSDANDGPPLETEEPKANDANGHTEANGDGDGEDAAPGDCLPVPQHFEHEKVSNGPAVAAACGVAWSRGAQEQNSMVRLWHAYLGRVGARSGCDAIEFSAAAASGRG